MSTITAKDGTRIYYKDWGSGQPVVFSHGWPLDADAWETQMVYLASNGYRCIAHDRRGHGRSDQPWNGNEMDTYADDLSELIETLDLHSTTMVGHSTGGGEVARYIGRHGTKRFVRVALVGAVAPLMVRTDANPGGLPIEAFDKIRAGVAADRSQFFKDLKRFDVPTLIIHGDDDQIVPIGASAYATSRLIKHATLRAYPGGPHGLAVTHKDTLNADLLALLRA